MTRHGFDPDQIREAAARVAAGGPRHVRVEAPAVPDYAASLELETPPVQLDADFHFQGEEADTAAFVVVLDAVNFGSGWFPTLRRRDDRSGYFHVARSLTERWHRGPLSARELLALDGDACADLFDQPRSGPPFELMTLFATALNALGAHLADHHRGSAARMVAAAQGSAVALAGELAGIPFFDDVHRYRGFDVPIYKRAQITPSDLALALGGGGLGGFADLDQLTIFADNLVPHVLRLDGVLVFDPVLEAAIDAGRLLEPGSEAEVEMRACAIHAVELLRLELRRRGVERTSPELDNVLWNRGQEPRYKATPRPRCRTVYY